MFLSHSKKFLISYKTNLRENLNLLCYKLELEAKYPNFCKDQNTPWLSIFSFCDLPRGEPKVTFFLVYWWIGLSKISMRGLCFAKIHTGQPSIGLPVYTWVEVWTVVYFELPGVCQGRPHLMLFKKFNCFRFALCYGATRGYHFIYATMSISFPTGNTTAEGSMGCYPRPFYCQFCEGLCFPGERRSGQLGLPLTLCFPFHSGAELYRFFFLLNLLKELEDGSYSNTVTHCTHIQTPYPQHRSHGLNGRF